MPKIRGRLFFQPYVLVTFRARMFPGPGVNEHTIIYANNEGKNKNATRTPFPFHM